MTKHSQSVDINTVFSSRSNPDDCRLGDSLYNTLSDSDFVLCGYPDDTGIKLNSGRPGAKEAPDAIRKILYKMTPTINTRSLYDFGNLNIQEDLSINHKNASEQALLLLKQKKQLITLGGGHDYGYPDADAFIQFCKSTSQSQKPIIINFDAHLDVRPTDNGLSSGTPFFRLLEKYNSSDFDFFEIGIQEQCNSHKHVQWVQNKKGRILNYETILHGTQPESQTILDFLGEHLLKPRPCFLSIDIDAFSSQFAMGCSQSWPTGFSPKTFFQILNILLQRLDVMMLSVYEVSPPLDLDNRTSKLAAQIIYQFLNSKKPQMFEGL